MKYLLIIIFLLINIAKAGTIDPHVPDARYIEYGSEFSCVGKLCGKYNDGTSFCASAVAISDKIIITAAHVVENSKECFITINNRVICISKIIINHQFKSDIVGIGDIAIGFCDESIGLDFYPSIYDDSNYVGKVCSISGYGMTGTFVTGIKKIDDHKRAGSNYIQSEYRDTVVCSASRPSEKNYTKLEFMIGSGDSGGGLFIDGKLAGVNSFVSTTDGLPNSSYTDESHHTSLFKYKDWVQENIR